MRPARHIFLCCCPSSSIGWWGHIPPDHHAVKKDVATETIQSKAEVFSVKPMFDGEILCVQLDTSSLSVEDAQAMLQCIDGVLSVERDG